MDASLFVPGPIAMSSAEAETNANTVGIMNLSMIRQAYCDIVYGCAERKYTVPVLVDNTAALLMSQNEKDSKRTRHMERRWLFNRHETGVGNVKGFHCPAQFQLADPATKNLDSSKYSLAMSVLETHVSDSSILPASSEGSYLELRRGVGRLTLDPSVRSDLQPDVDRSASGMPVQKHGTQVPSAWSKPELIKGDTSRKPTKQLTLDAWLACRK